MTPCRLHTLALAATALLAAGTDARAQQRPLVTEDPETIGAGRLLFEAGLDYNRDVVVPSSGLRGNVLSLPALGVGIGVSSIAEIQIDGIGYQRMAIVSRGAGPLASLVDRPADAATTSDAEDVSVGAKVRLLSESGRRPSFGLRFSTRLPNASNESGLGRDVQEFSVSTLTAKTVQSVRVVANVGLIILGDPAGPARQDDLLTYSLSVARAVSPATEVVGEVVGRANFAEVAAPGAEDRGHLRFGARYTRGSVRLDAGLLLGITPRDPELGVTVGFTWVLDAFRVP